MKILRNILMSAALIALSGCTAFSSFSEVEALNDAKPVGSPFTKALAGEYREFSNNELKSMLDYPDALHFARKGLAAASGEVVLPEPVSDWNLKDTAVQEMSAARGRLMVAFDMGARETAPALAAKAQVKFDCWIEQQEENFRKTKEASCKSDFMSSITQLEAHQQPAPPQQDAVTPIEGAPVAGGAYGVDASKPMKSENAMYLVFFNWNSAQIGSGAQSVLDAIAEEVKKHPPTSLNVIGYADTSGSSKYNVRLGFKRAKSVRDALVKRGVSASMLKTDSKGEAELLVQTPDNVREPANRRVNISFN